MTDYPSLKGRVAIVTGGARGLGLVMAKALMEQGAKVMMTAGRAQAELDRSVAEANAQWPGACRGMMADVSRWPDCQAAVAATIEAFGALDVVINNAARAPYEAAPEPGQPYPFWEADVDGHRRMVEANFLGPFLMARAAVPGMIARGFGKIINISTSRLTMVLAKGGPYGACKAGVEALTVAWAKDLAGTGVTANVFLPGGPADTALIWGEIGGRAMPGFKAGKGPKGQEGKVSGGLLPPEIMGPPIQYLCADESNAISGRRFVARDWDPDLPYEEAAAGAMQPVFDPPAVM
jgi:3-oxoacyl-[acyl-carrier protein] reductase